MGCIRTCRGRVTARKLRAEGSELGVENGVNINLPILLAKCARRMGRRAGKASSASPRFTACFVRHGYLPRACPTICSADVRPSGCGLSPEEGNCPPGFLQVETGMTRKDVAATSPAADGSSRIRMEPIRNLLLDAENPRLASSRSAHSQDDLVRILWSEMAVDEVALSIAANGYLPEEPLLVYWDRTKKKYVVVEGNRRLAAVRLLREDALRKKVGATDLPKLRPHEIRALETLPVSIYPDRKSLWKYTGFRHINGPKQWDSFSKAKYVAYVHDKYGKSLDEIARTIGDTHATVARLFRGYRILEQAEKKCGFDREDRLKARFAFSHLYTAVASPGFQRFLGISARASQRNPVPRRKLRNLRELMTWLYERKSSNTPPAITKQQPDLWDLEEVLSNPSALASLRSGYPLNVAFQIATGEQRRLREALTAAKEELRQARGSVIKYQGDDDLYEMANDIVELALAIKSEMESKRQGS